MTEKTVLVTGCFGYVGSRLTPLLLEAGYRVRGLDLCLYGEEGLHAISASLRPRLDFIRGDIRNPEVVNKAMSGVDSVIHLAAISNDPTGEIDDTLTRQVNFDAVGLLLSTAKLAGVKRFINASSSSVFGIKEQSSITERLEPEPLTSYSRYKMLSEWLVISAASEDFCTVNVRPATICGPSPRQRFDLTVNKLTVDGITKKQIMVHGGKQRRPNVGMTDIINLYKHLLLVPSDQISGRTFNFGFENLEVGQIAERIKGALGDKSIEIVFTDTQDRRDYHICSDKILSELGYKPVSSIEKEVAELRQAVESDSYGNPDDPRFHNMKSMKLDRSDKIYPSLP